MASDDVRSDRKYTMDHGWAREVGGVVEVGITAFAVDQLGMITLVSLDVKPGDTVVAGSAFGAIESVKTVSDLRAPISGKVERINADLANAPERVFEDAYGLGWMIAITPSDRAELAALLNHHAYSALLRTAAR